MKPKMPPAKFIKKAPAKSEEKTEPKKEKVAEKKNPALEKAETKPAIAAYDAKYQAEDDARTMERYAELAGDKKRLAAAKTLISNKVSKMKSLLDGTV